MSKKEYAGVSLPVALLTFAAVAAVMAVGLAILKLNTMVTFILAFVTVVIIALCTGMGLNKLEEVILTGFKKSALVGMIFIVLFYVFYFIRHLVFHHINPQGLNRLLG